MVHLAKTPRNLPIPQASQIRQRKTPLANKLLGTINRRRCQQSQKIHQRPDAQNRKESSMITQSTTLKCNGIARCPLCKTVQYIQTEINDTHIIRTCHNCEKSWETPHEPEYLELQKEIKQHRKNRRMK